MACSIEDNVIIDILTFEAHRLPSTKKSIWILNKDLAAHRATVGGATLLADISTTQKDLSSAQNNGLFIGWLVCE